MQFFKLAKLDRRLAAENGAALVQLQQQRLQKIVAHARAHSPFYRELYRNLPEAGFDLTDLPPVTKPQLMANFDAWAADRAVTRAGLDAFIRDKTRVGERYLRKYSVWTTSGTTGEPGIFLVDNRSQRLYNALMIQRGYRSWLTWGILGTMIRRGFHTAMILAVGDHYAGAANWARMRRELRLFASRLMIFPILEPLPSMVQRLNAFQPVIIASYPSMLALLAHEQTAGRLHIQPLMLNSLGEGLDETARGQIEAAFPHSRLADIYAASEFLFIGFECEQHWLHINSDWVLLEPVDDHNQPVPAGVSSANVLLTNLVNQVQPLLRYALGDSITLKPEPCACGNPLPALRVSGRTDEILYFPAAAGGMTGVLPMAIASVVEQVPGVTRYQIIQTAPENIKVRLEVEPGADRAAIWVKMEAELSEFFRAQGAAPVQALLADEEPQVNPVSGKFRHVFREYL